MTTVYGEGDLPVKTTAGQVTLVNNTAYDVFARPVRTEYGVLGRKVYRTSELDEHTGLLNRRTIDGDVALRIDDTRYGYDPAGNVTRVSSTAGQGDSASTDTQCFDIDPLRRLTQAWTTKDPKDACNGAPSAGTVGGPDSYWHTLQLRRRRQPHQAGAARHRRYRDRDQRLHHTRTGRGPASLTEQRHPPPAAATRARSPSPTTRRATPPPGPEAAMTRPWMGPRGPPAEDH
ncbi:hypothetical protein [Streptomyces sp. N1]|uniref:hypothetical protein n=1 Tax=Streptomyces sp. N1 TaxID=576456 RepID=UPI001F506F08|nr:hypothetical protein [Streptomyces sp. N1]